MAQAIKVILNNQRWEWSRMEGRLRGQSPLSRVRSDRQRLDELARRMGLAVEHRQQIQHARLTALEQRLAVLSPSAVLGRGFALVRHPDGRIVSHVQEVKLKDRLQVLVSDGTFRVQVVEIPGEGKAEADGEHS
jgi:exodeoxyribonuclease VII large subunit